MKRKNQSKIESTRIVLRTATLCGLVIIAPGVVFAESGDHAGHGPSITELIPYWINFLLYVGILYFLLRKTVVRGWAARRQKIIDNISSAKEQFSQAQSLLNDAQSKWSRLTQEETRVRDEIARQAEFERRQMLESARSKAERMVLQAREHGLAERRSAEREIREELVDDVLSRALGILKQSASAETDRAFRSAAVGAAGRLVN